MHVVLVPAACPGPPLLAPRCWHVQNLQDSSPMGGADGMLLAVGSRASAPVDLTGESSMAVSAPGHTGGPRAPTHPAWAGGRARALVLTD